MTIEQKMMLLLRKERFIRDVKIAREEKTGLHRTFTNWADFNNWNEIFTSRALNQLKRPGTVIENKKQFEKFRVARDCKISENDIEKGLRFLLNTYKLPLSAKNYILDLILFNKAVFKKDKNYQIILRYEDNRWNLDIRVNGLCRSEGENGIRWDKDVRPFQKLLIDYKAKQRPIKEIKKSKIAASKTARAGWKELAYKDCPNLWSMSNDKRHKTQKRIARNLKTRSSRLNKELDIPKSGQ